MEKITLITQAILLLIGLNSFSQEEAQTPSNHSRFSILASGGMGYGKVENDKEANYNLNSNYAEVLLNYKVSKNFGLATGIGFNELSGNGFNSAGNFYHERSVLKIPLLATFDYQAANKFKTIWNFGFYAQNIVDETYTFSNIKYEDVYEDWNFGFQLGVGLVFELSQKVEVGVNFNFISDFTDFKTKNNQFINDEQRITNLSTIGVLLLYKL